MSTGNLDRRLRRATGARLTSLKRPTPHLLPLPSLLHALTARYPDLRTIHPLIFVSPITQIYTLESILPRKYTYSFQRRTTWHPQRTKTSKPSSQLSVSDPVSSRIMDLAEWALTRCFQARIKRIMQKDEEVGKVAQATPIVICMSHPA